MGDLPRLEMFAREKAEGWDTVGNDIDGKDIRETLENMTKYEEIKQYLEANPTGRERSNKNKFIAFILDRKFPQVSRGLTLSELQDVIEASWVYDRAWRQVLQHHEHLRGSDYGDKAILEQEKELELGYTPGFNMDLKSAKNL